MGTGTEPAFDQGGPHGLFCVFQRFAVRPEMCIRDRSITTTVITIPQTADGSIAIPSPKKGDGIYMGLLVITQ